jgi:hypothetical protein
MRAGKQRNRIDLTQVGRSSRARPADSPTRCG